MLSLAGYAAALSLLLWVLVNVVLVAVYRRELWRHWREPVFRHPVLVIESDDWGAGPLSQAAALRDIAEVLSRHRDASGRVPSFNLALVLAVPDGPAIQAGGAYRRVELDALVFKPIVTALIQGQTSGVFALQLHGMEHFWPAALMASQDRPVQAWLRQPVPASTEHLPSPLQSRWVDASGLPSKPHAESAIRDAVAAEVQVYTRIFGAPPRVVVPPTFVWTREVELAWAGQGVDFIVTPGWRYTCRNAQGQPSGDEGPFLNGERKASVTYLARTDYFEPSRGRGAQHALRVLARAAAEARVCLLENHRDNFIIDAQQSRTSLTELDDLYRDALKQHPDLRFLSSLELGAVLRARDPQWLLLGTPERLPYLWQRLRHAGRLWKIMRLTGLAALGALALVIMRRSPAE